MILSEQFLAFKLFSCQPGWREIRSQTFGDADGVSTVVVKHVHKRRAAWTPIDEGLVKHTFTTAQRLVCKMKWSDLI